MGMADDQAPGREGKDAAAEKTRRTHEAQRSMRVLCVGGVLDGQWKVVDWSQRHGFDAMRPMNLTRMVKAEMASLDVGFPERDRYRIIGPIRLWGTGGVSVALDRDTLMDKYHGDEERMMLKAILQRDVATEMGL